MSHNVQLIVDLRRISIEKIINQKRSAPEKTYGKSDKEVERIHLRSFFIAPLINADWNISVKNNLIEYLWAECQRRVDENIKKRREKKDKISGKNRDGKRSWHILHISAETEALRNTNNTFKKYSL